MARNDTERFPAMRYQTFNPPSPISHPPIKTFPFRGCANRGYRSVSISKALDLIPTPTYFHACTAVAKGCSKWLAIAHTQHVSVYLSPYLSASLSSESSHGGSSRPNCAAAIHARLIAPARPMPGARYLIASTIPI